MEFTCAIMRAAAAGVASQGRGPAALSGFAMPPPPPQAASLGAPDDRENERCQQEPFAFTASCALRRNVSILHVVQDGIPEMIPTEACSLGWQESLALLAMLVQAEIPGP